MKLCQYFLYPAKKVVLLQLFSLLLLTNSQSVYAENLSATNDLEAELGEISAQYYSDKLNHIKNNVYDKKNIENVIKIASQLKNENKSELANTIIAANFPLIKRNIDFNSLSFFLPHFISQNMLNKGSELVDSALEQEDLFITAKVHYYLANYYFDRGKIDKAVSHINSISSSDALSNEERDHITILYGIALQHRKQHRSAIKTYDKVKPGSKYYSYAQLNMAVAQIRQGWWTDVQISIDKALKNKKRLTELDNRLLLVLAYSQLQNEFYRNARNTLRQISLTSIYSNRALLALGLCALSQKDYKGSINAFKHLQKRNTNELSVMESHLLIPYSHEQSGALDKAVLGYNQAIVFFSNKSREISNKISELKTYKITNALPDNWLASATIINKNNYKTLLRLRKNVGDTDSSMISKVTNLKHKYESTIINDLISHEQVRLDNISSYLSQSEYGLAKLYDNKR